jgi:pyruvate formate lyase activating enzyme
VLSNIEIRLKIKIQVGAARMEIRGFVDTSFSDWDGKVSSVIFLPRCNLRCPFCYNKNLVLCPENMPAIPQEKIENYLKMNRKWIDGVVLTGGEPSLHWNLPLLCEEMKEIGLKVKVDTNGTNPAMIRKLIKKQCVDFVALDLKAPFTEDKYSEACGVNAAPFLRKIKETTKVLLSDVVEYEFRTTVVPTMHRREDIEEICLAIKGCRKFALQNFKSEVETINPKYQNLKPFSQTQMELFLQVAKLFIANVVLRG